MISKPFEPIVNLEIGQIIEVDGTHLIAELNPQIKELSRVYGGETYQIGQFGSIIKIHRGRKVLYAYVGRLRMKSEYEKELGYTAQSPEDGRVVEADLFGEGEWLRVENDHGEEAWILKFERGVSNFPLPTQKIYLTPSYELRQIYGSGQDSCIMLGEHVGSAGTPCFADINELIGKHTAILGSTGSGKSGTVAAILHSIINFGVERKLEKWNPQIIILDPHDEYSKAFSSKSTYSTDNGTLKLPYWLLTYNETLNLILGKTQFVATSQANIVKKALWEFRCKGSEKIGIDKSKITIDSPIPYSFDGFIKSIEAERNTLTTSKQDSHNSILDKIENLLNDGRLRFLFEEWDGTSDPLLSIARQFIESQKPIKIIDLSGVPNEIAGICSAVIARTLFNFKVWEKPEERQNNPLLLVCEEAHRYVPNKGEAQYEAAQDAIRRIAKEGRKYGLGLFLVSQRPSEVETTVLSQCNSWIVLRLTNDSDREQVKSILPDSLSGLTKVLSGLRRREALFVGQAAMLPSRILIKKLGEAQLPKSADISYEKGWSSDVPSDEMIVEIAKRWRCQTRN